tara:strand:+ start:3617 stop:4231 length:615 start_codon:yes stop_codon:yes gene_type:complete
MEPTYPHVPQVVIPYVATKKDIVDMSPVPWNKRKLIILAGHVPKLKFSTVRAKVAQTLKNVANATVLVGKNRLSEKDYKKSVLKHKFCVVAAGDTRSTKKVAEMMVIGANGGCIPLLINGVTKPYTQNLYTQSTFEVSRLDSSTISFIHTINETKYAAMVAELQRVEKFFSQPTASQELLSRLCNFLFKYNLYRTSEHIIPFFF